MKVVGGRFTFAPRASPAFPSISTHIKQHSLVGCHHTCNKPFVLYKGILYHNYTFLCMPSYLYDYKVWFIYALSVYMLCPTGMYVQYFLPVCIVCPTFLYSMSLLLWIECSLFIMFYIYVDYVL